LTTIKLLSKIKVGTVFFASFNEFNCLADVRSGAMLNPLEGGYFVLFSRLLQRIWKKSSVRRSRVRQRRIEELESRLAPASFFVSGQLEVSSLDWGRDLPGDARAVVFFESAVANNQILREALPAGTDAVVLDSSGDGLQEMAAFLASRHNLSTIGVVAHGAPGIVDLGTATLDLEDVWSYRRELATVGSALGAGGELDLWSCDVAAGPAGMCLVQNIAFATGAGVAAADHLIGAALLGGSWALDVRVAGAHGNIPFGVDALQNFAGLLGNWSPAAAMSSVRSGQTATLLDNGKVLVTGGQDVSTSADSSSAELYDPDSNTWSSAGSMASARVGQTATLLANGKVLVVGGNDDSKILATAELYDPTTNKWLSAGSMAMARVYQTATLLPSGKVLVVGGTNLSALASAEVYDPVSNTWSSAASLATARYGQTATLLGNGKVLAAGGYNGVVFVASGELYDPATDTWSAAGTMATGRYFHTATLLVDGKVLVTGGLSAQSTNNAESSAELYDPASNTWSTAGSMATARAHQTATLLANGAVLITGGNNFLDGPLSSAEVYNPSTNSWLSGGAMATARFFQTATLLQTGKVLIAGGITGIGGNAHSLSTAELYDSDAPIVSITITGGAYNGLPYSVANAQVTGIGNSNLASFGDPTLTYSYYAGTTASGAGSATAPTNAGTYTVVGHWTSNNALYTSADSPPATFTITPIALTVTGIVVNNKVYDATTKATLNTSGAVLVGVLPGDTVTLDTTSAAGAFAAKDVATGVTVAVSGLTLSGAQAGDYILTQPTATANITPLPLTVTAVANTKTFDGTTAAAGIPAITTAAQGSDTASFIETYDNSAVGTGKKLTPAGAVSDGNGGRNYTYTFVSANTGVIAPVGTTTAASTSNSAPVYGTAVTLTATVAPASGSVMPTQGSVQFFIDGNTSLGTTNIATTDANHDAIFTLVTSISQLQVNGGTAQPITATYVPGSGFTASSSTNQIFETVSPLPITVTALGKTKVYGAADPPLTYTISGGPLVSGDAFTGTLTRVPGENAGSYAIKQGTVAASGNYAITFVPADLTITPALPIVTATSPGGVYNGLPYAAIDAAAAGLNGVPNGGFETGDFTGWTLSGNTAAALVIANDPSGAAGSHSGNDYAQLTTPSGPGLGFIAQTVNTTPGQAYLVDYWLRSSQDAANDWGAYWNGTLLDDFSVSGQLWTEHSYQVTATASSTELKFGNSFASGFFYLDDVSVRPILASFGDPSLSYTYYAGATTSGTGSASAPTHASDYTVVAHWTSSNPNFASADSGPVTFTIAPAPITVAADAKNKPQGATDPPFTYHVTAGSLVAGDAFTGALTRAPGEAPGSYPIEQGTLALSADYVLTYVGANLTVTPAIQFSVTVLGSPSVEAGSSFLFTVQAVDSSGNPIAGYSGPANVTITTFPPDPQGGFPVAGTLSSAGFGFFQGNLKTAGSYTLTATAGAFSGTSSNLTVLPTAANYFTVAAPPTATTGNPVNVTVTAFDRFANVASAYNGRVHFTSSDSAATLPSDSSLSGGRGIFSFTLNTAGSQTVTATDNLSTNPIIGGTSSPITTRGLIVTSFTPSATGFTAAFSKAFVPADLTLYGAGQTVQDVKLVGAHVGAINGSLIIDTSNQSITFKATANGLSLLNDFASVVLPDDTYTVTLVSGSGSNGLLDGLGAGLDGTGTGGHADYTTTFTTHYQSNGTPVLAIPDFARGPDGAHTIKVPNDTAQGIPVTLYNATLVSDVTFTLSYNPALLTVSGGTNGDATNAASTFVMAGNPTIIDATHATAVFHFSSGEALSGTVVLGDVEASVPDSAASTYKAKELLQLGAVSVNQTPFTGVSAAAVHVNAYLGDVTGNGTIDGLDVATASNVAQGSATGFAAYTLADPAIVGDAALDYSVDAGNVSDLAAFTVRVPVAALPAIPTGLTITPVGADPTLSLGAAQRQGDKEKGRQGETSTSPGLLVSLSPGLVITVPVMLDDPYPAGSTGMMEAVLALSYDPSVLSVSSADITLGSIPSSGSDWRIVSTVDQASGRIGIELYSTVPITVSQAGSLVNIGFHLRSGAIQPTGSGVVQLVDSIILNGQRFVTQVDDAQGQLVLSPGADRLVDVYRHSPRFLAAEVLFQAMASWMDARDTQSGSSANIFDSTARASYRAAADRVFAELP
jgi:hypothetical protein